MSRMITALASLFRRWRYVEDSGSEAPRTAASGETEVQRLRKSIARDEKLIADFRRNGCPGLAKAREASVRSMRSRLAILES